MDMEDYRTELMVNLKSAQELALASIKEAQQKQKAAYDQQSTSSVYKVGKNHGLHAQGGNREGSETSTALSWTVLNSELNTNEC